MTETQIATGVPWEAPRFGRTVTSTRLHLVECPHLVGREWHDATDVELETFDACQWSQDQLSGVGRAHPASLDDAMRDLGAPAGMELHVGRGVTRGAMTVFPIWSTETGFSRYSADPVHLDVSECEDGPAVERLMVRNTGEKPALVLEGQLFEGGWQHRMARQSMLIGVRRRLPVPVACVEQGRWGGTERQHTRGRRATPYVHRAVDQAGDVQSEVWARVARHTEGTHNATGSLVQHLDRAGAGAGRFRRLPGQVGVLIGIGGQPYVAEVFDSQSTLRRQFDAIVGAAWLDAQLAPPVPTPGRRARRFVERTEEVWRAESGAAGIATRMLGRSEYVDVASLRWRDRDVHTRMTNVRHPLLVAA